MCKTSFFIWSVALATISSAAPLVNVAFMGVDPVEVSESAASGISESLLNELINTNRFTMVERDRISDLLEEQGLSLSGCTTTECYVKVGQLTGAEKVLVGNLSQVERSYILNVRIVDVYTGTIEFSDSEKSRSLDSLLSQTRNIAQRLAAKIPVTGTVISVTADSIKVDMGLQEGVVEGDDLVVFRYGEEYYHPETGLLLGRDVEELGEAKITKVLANELSEARLVGPFSPQVGDKVRMGEHEVAIETTPVVEPEVTTPMVEEAPADVSHASVVMGATYAFISNAAYSDAILSDDNVEVSSGGPGVSIGTFLPFGGGFFMFTNAGFTVFTDKVEYDYGGSPVSTEITEFLISCLVEFQYYFNEKPLEDDFSWGVGVGICYDNWTFTDGAADVSSIYDSWFGYEVSFISLLTDFIYFKLKGHVNTSTSHTWDEYGEKITVDHPSARFPAYLGLEIGVSVF
jgi:TolB-like protein